MKVNIKNYPATNYGADQKIDIQIDPWDTWSLDCTLAKIIYPALLQLKDNKQGVPADFAEVGGEQYSPQCSFDFYEESSSATFDIRVKQWDEVFDKMIWSFRQIANDDVDNKYHHGEIEWAETSFTAINPMTGQSEEFHKMSDANPDSHWYDVEGHMLHEARIQEGLDLFAKYYRNLWD